MKIRRNHFLHTALAGVFAYMLMACNSISEEDRLIYVKPAEVNRNVLIEDFTGQRCVNCPTATEEIKKLQEQYGDDHVIAVAIHGGDFGIYTSTSSVKALSTEEARAYYNKWNIEAQPAGLVNRRGGVSNYTAWAASTYNELQKATPISMSLSAVIDSASSSIEVTTYIQSSEPLTCNLQLWLTEDNVTALQLMPDGSPNPEYLHQHIFRKSINGTWGTELALTESQVEATFTTEIDSDWQLDNLCIVAFVYNQDGVQQATKQSIYQSINNK